jgi:hypothetical protein
MRHENLLRERAAFTCLDEAGAQYIDDWAEELGGEEIENETMEEEDHYKRAYDVAKGCEHLHQEMEVVCTPACPRASRACQLAGSDGRRGCGG